jgi:quinol monooxygenase YgiN
MKLALATLIVLLVAQFGAAQDAKLYVVTHVDLTPPYIADGTPLLLKFAADSRKEKSAARFELLQEPGRKNHFTIVSVWENQAAFDAHLGADHTKQFREKLQPMLGGPLDERLHGILQ